MTMYFRFFIMLLRCLLMRNKQPLLEPTRCRFRVLPFDCDINLHLNNARYLSFMDLGRFHFLGQSGLLKQFYKRRWLPVIAAIEVSFIRALDPLQKFDLVTRVLAWDDRYVYTEQRFEVDGNLMAIAIIKGVILTGKQRLPINTVIEAVAPGIVSPPIPDVILQWQGLVEAKKRGAE